MSVVSPLTFLLVTGAKRSGTTALAASLNTHPEVGILQEYGPNQLLDDIGAFFKRWRFQFGSDGPPKEPGEDFDLATFPLPNLHRDFEPLLKAVYAAVFPGKPLRVFGDKAPLFANDQDFGRLPSTLPGTRVLHVVRNPVDTALSNIRRAELAARGVDVWEVTRVDQACREWIDDARAAERLLLSQGCPTLVIKYEDLLSQDAGGVWARIADFVGVDNLFAPTMRERRRPRRPEHAWREFLEDCFEGFDEAWPSEPVEALLERARHLELPVHVGQVVSFDRPFEGWSYVRSGFAEPESGGCWSEGTQAEIAFRAGPVSSNTRLEIDFSSRVAEGKPLHVGIDVNGEYRKYTLNPLAWDEEFRVDVPLPHGRLGPNRQVRVKFEIFEPKTPKEEPFADTRAIGIFLRRFRLSGATVLSSTNLFGHQLRRFAAWTRG
jgi:hypothetical protein